MLWGGGGGDVLSCLQKNYNFENDVKLHGSGGCCVYQIPFAQIQNESFQKINQNWKYLKSSFSLFVMKNHESIMSLSNQ